MYLKGQLKYDVDNGSRIRRDARSLGGPEVDGLGGCNGVFIQAITEAADDSEYAYLTGRGEQNLEQHLALDSLAARFRGVGRPRFRENLDGSRDRQRACNAGAARLAGENRRCIVKFSS